MLVLDAKDGKVIEQLTLPSQVVACGLAAAGGQLIASCVDGSVVAFGQGE